MDKTRFGDKVNVDAAILSKKVSLLLMFLQAGRKVHLQNCQKL